MMRTTRTIATIVMVFAVPSGLIPAFGEDYFSNNDLKFASWSEANQQFASMETELASLRSQIANLGGAVQDEYSDCEPCMASDSWFAGFEGVILQPHFTGEVEIDNGEPGYGNSFSPRLWLGYRNACGLGLRARYWDAEFESDEPTPNFLGRPTPFTLKMKTFDLEVTQLASVGAVNLDFAGGFRFGRAEHHDAINLVGVDFEGIGPTVCVEALIPVTGDWSLLGNVRGSLLYGDGTSVQNNGNTVTTLETDYTGVYETQLGAEYSRCAGNGGVFKVRSLIEAQTWGTAVGDPGSLTNRNDSQTGLIGYAFSVIYER